MQQYRLADRVRIDIPDVRDSDFRFHGEHGMVLSRQDRVYEVALDEFSVVLEVTKEEVRPPFY
ncbi:hypothetical protein halTADL_0208 [Halohasta litchfieldiae]|jgi:ribosomal protein L21E|uniref:DUF8139 domain-containing protein n=1 Tax=Halohasta litchfieldiae TaxID=1073996 RepID=A0A1H6T931_9EURY|nr:hypothetical protein halTADL_0208 [Halohasta litchfieldiae]SEI72735.1 hypothetical protein SAMN05444271_106138 [Halohasta litchfieldiae]